MKPHPTELMQAIERAEQIAVLLETVPTLAKQEIAGIECLGPLLAEYNQMDSQEQRGGYGRSLDGLLRFLGLACNGPSISKQDPRAYAGAIRGYCKILRQHLIVEETALYVVPLTESQKDAYDLIRNEGPLFGKEVVDRLGIGSESAFTTHYVPALKQHGIRNRRGLGYYHPDSYDPD